MQKLQRRDGHWVFELEADATIPAEYILLDHFLDEIDTGDRARRSPSTCAQRRATAWRLAAVPRRRLRHQRLGQGLLRAQAGRRRSVDAPHMVRAREAILDRGGAARANVFTRIALALFGQVPWRGVPVMPVEIMLLPRWFPFHLSKVRLLVAHRHRAAARPGGAEAGGAQPARRRHPRAVHGAAGGAQAATCTTRPARCWGDVLLSARPGSAAGRAACFPRRAAATGDRHGDRLHPRAAERRGRAGRASSRPWPTRSWPSMRSAMPRDHPDLRDRQAGDRRSCS